MVVGVGLHTNCYHKSKADDIAVICPTLIMGGRWDSNGEAIEPIPNKKAQTEGRAINHNNIGSTHIKESQPCAYY